MDVMQSIYDFLLYFFLSAAKVLLGPFRPKQPWSVVELLFQALAISLTVFVTLKATQRRIDSREKREEKKRTQGERQLIHLLKDEITKRWPNILRDLKRICEECPSVCLEHFKGIRYREDDLFIFHAVAESFQNYHYLNKNDLLSDIIYGHMLFKDFIDFQKQVKSGPEKKNDASATCPYRGGTDYTRFVDALKDHCDKLDEKFATILKKLEKMEEEL